MPGGTRRVVPGRLLGFSLILSILSVRLSLSATSTDSTLKITHKRMLTICRGASVGIVKAGMSSTTPTSQLQ